MANNYQPKSTYQYVFCFKPPPQAQKHEHFQTFKGALCGFGEDVSIRRQTSSLTDLLYLDKRNKQPLFGFMTA